MGLCADGHCSYRSVEVGQEEKSCQKTCFKALLEVDSSQETHSEVQSTFLYLTNMFHYKFRAQNMEGFFFYEPGEAAAITAALQNPYFLIEKRVDAWN